MDDFASVIKGLNDTYCFYRQDYISMGQKYVKRQHHPYTDDALTSHLNGAYNVCVFSGPQATRFVTFDVDAGGKAAVRKVVDTLVKLGIPRERVYISTSGKKGYHVDVFFSPWIRNGAAKNLYELVIWQSGLDPAKVEFYPQPEKAIKLPLGVHKDTGKRCWFLDQKTLKPIESLEYINTIVPLDRDVLEPIFKEWNKKRWNELYAQMVCDGYGDDGGHDIVFDSVYYEAMRILVPGTRHDVMLQIACDLRRYGANSYQIEKALKGFYYHQDKSVIDSSEREVLAEIENIAAWAEETVAVTRERKAPEKKHRALVFNKYDVAAILSAETPIARKIATVIYAFCKIYKEAHISYEKIAQIVGCSQASVPPIVKALCDGRVIKKESGGCFYNSGRLIRRTNTYEISFWSGFDVPDGTDLVGCKFEWEILVNNDTIEDLYYGMLTGICSLDYLEKFLKKPELEKCRQYLNGRTMVDD